jgi:hypothetical protein
MVSFYNALLVLDVSKILDMSLSILSTFPIFKAFKIILLVLLISVLWITLFVTRELLRPRLSALRALPGPEGGTFLLGHLSVMCEDWHKQMIQEYGHVIRYKVDLGVSGRLTVLFHPSHVYNDASRDLVLSITNFSRPLLFTEG